MSVIESMPSYLSLIFKLNNNKKTRMLKYAYIYSHQKLKLHTSFLRCLFLAWIQCPSLNTLSLLLSWCDHGCLKTLILCVLGSVMVPYKRVNSKWWITALAQIFQKWQKFAVYKFFQVKSRKGYDTMLKSLIRKCRYYYCLFIELSRGSHFSSKLQYGLENNHPNMRGVEKTMLQYFT